MAVTIRVLGDLRRFLDSEVVEIQGDGCSLSGALEELARLYPRLGQELFDAQGRLHYAVVLRVSGRPVAWPADKDTMIESGGELLLTRFHAGG